MALASRYQLQRDIKKEKEWSHERFEELGALKQKYMICNLCDKKGTVHKEAYDDKHPEWKLIYCKKHLNDNIKLNKEMGPMLGQMIVSAAKTFGEMKKEKK